jgi:hypothetical protein
MPLPVSDQACGLGIGFDVLTCHWFDIGAKLNRRILYHRVIYGQVGIAGPFSNRALQHYRAFVPAA